MTRLLKVSYRDIRGFVYTHKGKGRYKCTKCNIEGKITNERDGRILLHVDSTTHDHEAPPQNEDEPIYLEIKEKAFEFVAENAGKYGKKAKEATEDFWNEYIDQIPENKKDEYTRVYGRKENALKSAVLKALNKNNPSQTLKPCLKSSSQPQIKSSQPKKQQTYSSQPGTARTRRENTKNLVSLPSTKPRKAIIQDEDEDMPLETVRFIILVKIKCLFTFTFFRVQKIKKGSIPNHLGNR